MNIYEHDEALYRKGFLRIAGIDEAGRGPLAGPVVAGAVVLNRTGQRINRLRDSKKVPEKERKTLFWDILISSADIGVGIVGSQIIDEINILNATKLAMQLAVEDLSLKPDMLLIDALELPSADLLQMSHIRGESVSAAIAAASIVAKYVRDSMMLDYHTAFPVYNFAKHKGYATKEHIDNIKRYGPSPIHRKTFRKVMITQEVLP